MSLSRTPGIHPVQNTSTVLIANNSVFEKGRVILETDTNRIKTGDGVSTYTQLTYVEWNYEIVEAAGTDTYTGNFSKPFLLAYFDMMRIRVKFTNANTGASTINLNGLGAKAIKKQVSVALVSGDILAGGIYDLTYDGTNFQIDLASVPPGTGTVTSFSAGDLSPLFTTAEATPTTTPALSFTAVNQAANLFYAGPASGAAAAPTFRALVDADLPITWTDYSGTSTVVGWSSTSTLKIYYARANKVLFISVDINGTSNSTTITFTLPNTSINNGAVVAANLPIQARDNGTWVVGMAQILINSATVTCYTSVAGAAWTNSGAKTIRISLQIPIQ